LIPRLLAFSLMLGGLRDPRLFAVAGAAAWAAVWLRRPTLGPAAWWLPWLAWAAVSALAASQPLAALPALARWSAVLACASLAAGWDTAERAQWLRAFLIAAAGVAAAAFASGAGAGGGGQMTGVLPPYSNYSAFVLTGAASAAAAWALHPRGLNGRERAAALALCAFCVACVILARSRGASLGLAAAASVFVARRWGPRALAAAAVAAAVFAGGLLAGAFPASWENALLKKYRMHAEARPRIWTAAAAIASDAPWRGVGPGNFAAGFRLRPVPFEDGAARWSMTTDYAHSEPLQAAAETGWAGLALWLLAAGTALRALLQRAGDDPVREAAALAAAALTAHLLVDNMLHIPALAALWMTALAGAAPPTAGGRVWPRAAILAGAALALVCWIPRSLAASSPARAAILFPADPSPREDLAYAAAAAGRAAEADAHWRAAERLAPFNAIHPWRRGQLAGAFGRWNEAERLAARAVKLEPGFLTARLLRADALARLGRAPEARAELEALRRAREARGIPALHSGYEEAVWRFDESDYRRIAARLRLPAARLRTKSAGAR